MSYTPRETQPARRTIDDTANHQEEFKVTLSPANKALELKSQKLLWRRRFIVPLTLLLIYQIVFAIIGHYQAMPPTLPPRSLLTNTMIHDDNNNDIPPPVECRGSSSPKRRLAVASFLANPSHLFGTYSIRQQMKKTGMNVPYLVVIPDDFANKFPAEYQVLVDMIGEQHVIPVPTDFILQKITDHLWRGVFNKLWLFNLVDHADKIITLDQDVLIRQNLMHWFDYPAPAATQAKDNVEWNSGAMVIEPNAEVFEAMMAVLPYVRPHAAKREIPFNETNKQDGWNSGFGQQGFLSSFFTHEMLNATMRMKTMPTEASVLSSSFKTPPFQYFAQYRLHIFETIHLTSAKPWKSRTRPSNRYLCAMLREWQVSMQGFEKYNATIVLTNDYLRDCPPEENTTSMAQV